MKPLCPTGSTESSLADRLHVLAELWQHVATEVATRPIPNVELDALRDGLNALAEEAECGTSDELASALRRIALLSEVWECLQFEPDRPETGDGIVTFCLDAMQRFAGYSWHGAASGGDGVGEWVLRQSDERWGHYLSPLDPTNAGPSLTDEPDSSEESEIDIDDAPALEAHALLSLLTRSAYPGSQSTRLETPPEPQPVGENAKYTPCDDLFPSVANARHESREEPTRSSPAHPVCSTDQPNRDGSVRRGTAIGLEIPPLPARIDLDDEMREAFLADASDLFERIEQIVFRVNSRDNARDALHELGRCLHTLKGAAGSVGLKELAALVHELEGRLAQANDSVSQDVNDVLHGFVGYLDGLIVLLRRGPDRQEETAPGSSEAPATSQTAGSDGPIRVPASRFDELTDLASELIMQGRFWLSQSGSMKAFAETAQLCRNRLLGSLDRLHDFGLGREGRIHHGLTDARADLPAQLRRLTEQASDLAVLAESARTAAASMVDRGDTLVRVSLQLWDSLQALRIVPIRGLFQRLARVVHEAARVEGRQVEVVMAGEETGVDRAVQDRAFEPLLHVARNAVSHGIESPTERARAGKPPAGRVALAAHREGNTLVIAIEDDGKGLDEDAIAAKARRLGRLGPDETLSRDRLRALIFESGFSTRSQANDISGRGVGMDVVAREVGQLRGTLDVDSQTGRGTRLTLRLPARLALEPALIVRVGGQPFAFPASQVEQAQPFEPPAPSRDPSLESARAAPEDLTVTYRDETIPVIFGREVVGVGRPDPALWPTLLLVRTGTRLIGLVVDAIDRAEDLVIKPMGELLAGHPLVSGTSLSINGEVILVLNAAGLERWFKLRKAPGSGPAVSSPVPGRDDGSPGGRMAVLVVDDSISVRRGVARQLHGLGLDVHEVSDGVEALRRLRSSCFGLVVTDLEMPRLDGLALLAEIKRSPTLAPIPVIVASTRGDSETRRRVLDLGGEAFLAKPVDPSELVRLIEPFLPRG